MSDLTASVHPLGAISEACETSLASADLTLRDQAAAALLRHYAALMDRAESLSKMAIAVWDDLSLEDIDGRKRLYKLEQAVAAQSVASDLGPKLLAGLTALGCTLAGRGVKGKEATGATDSKRAAHDEVAARRAQRQHDAAVADPAAR